MNYETSFKPLFVCGACGKKYRSFVWFVKHALRASVCREILALRGEPAQTDFTKYVTGFDVDYGHRLAAIGEDAAQEVFG